MLSAGISIIETIDSLLEDAKGNQKRILENLRADLVQGKRIHQSFAKFPTVFDKVTVSVIKAAEEAGNLDTTLKDIRDNIKKENDFMEKIKTALTYPAVIFVVFLGVLLTILIVVIPKISVVFSRLKVDLPLPTRIMVFLSNIMISYTLPFIIGLIAFVGLFALIYSTNKKFILSIF